MRKGRNTLFDDGNSAALVNENLVYDEADTLLAELDKHLRLLVILRRPKEQPESGQGSA